MMPTQLPGMMTRRELVDFRSDCHIAVKRAFDSVGITIPLPQQVEYSRPYSEIDVRKVAQKTPEPEDDPAP